MNKGSVSLLYALAYFKCFKTSCDDCALFFGDIVIETTDKPRCMCDLAFSLITRAKDKLEIDAKRIQARFEVRAAKKIAYINTFIDDELDEEPVGVETK